MILNSKFDVLRGWPREGAIDESYTINQATPGTDDSIPMGTIFYVNTSGFAQATGASPNRTSANGVATYVCVAGNDDFSSQFVHKVVGLRGNAMFKLDPSNFNAGSYTPGTKLTFAAGGKWQPAVATNQIIGEVVQDNTATDGTIVVFYTGGDAASF